MSFSVDPNTLFNASARFLDLRTHTDQLLGAMMSELSSTAGMAGADEFIGAKFAEQYDKAARGAAEGLAKIDAHLGQIASGLLSTATNYWRADSASNMQFPVDVNAPAQQLNCDNAYAFKKENVATAQGAGVDTWDVISGTALALIWPQGDTDKMRHAADVWMKVATGLSNLNIQCSAAVNMVTGPNTGETITAFASHCAQLTDTVCYSQPVAGGAAIPNMQALCGQLSSFCRTAADKIDDARETIKWMLVGAGVVAVAGIALTVFTLGASDAAAVAIDAAIVADAEATVIAVAAGIEAEIAASTIVAIEEFLASVATVQVGTAALTVIGAITIGGIIIFGDGSTAYAAPGVPGAPGSPGTGPFIGPMPPLTPAEQAAFQAWRATFVLDPTGTHIGVPPNAYWPETGAGPQYDYQRRVAGDNVYRMSTGLPPPNGMIDADGLRASDGAIIDAKYTGDPSCSPYNLDNAATFTPEFLYSQILGDQDREVLRYTAALNNPANHGKFIEFIVNDPALVPYFEALMVKNGTYGRVVYQP